MTKSENGFDGYTDQAVDAITRAARNEQDFLAWLVGVLAAVAAELKSSRVLPDGRPALSEAGEVAGLVGGTVGWGDDVLRGHAEKLTMPAVALWPLSRLVGAIVWEIQLPAAGCGEPNALSGEDIDAIAEHVEDLIGRGTGASLVDAGALAAEEGVARDWLYGNAGQLCGVALGDGRAAPLRPDAERAREAPSDSVGIATYDPSRRRRARGAPSSTSELARTRLAVLSGAAGTANHQRLPDGSKRAARRRLERCATGSPP